MPRIDDYENARKLAIEKLAAESFASILRRTGFEAGETDQFRLAFLNRVYRVDFPELLFKDEAEPEKEIPIQEQILILHYMSAEAPPSLTGNWVSYREIQGATFYFSAFVKRAIDPLKNAFGRNIEGLLKAAGLLGGRQIEAGDAGYEFRLLPNVPVRMILWTGDDEFPAAANIVFDQNISGILSPEDVAWMAGMLAYRLIALSN
jgi:hypothetical protein